MYSLKQIHPSTAGFSNVLFLIVTTQTQEPEPY